MTLSIRIALLLAVILINVESLLAQFIYHSPVNGSKHHKTETTIVLRTASELAPASLSGSKWIRIEGSQSGIHSFTSRLALDGRTVIVTTDEPFSYDELVSVTVNDQLQLMSGEPFQETTFTFTTERKPTAEQLHQRQLAKKLYDQDVTGSTSLKQEVQTDSMPSFKITVNNNASKGSIFWNCQNDFHPEWTNSYNTIMSNNGKFSFAKDMGLNGHDFKINYNGYMTYFDYDNFQWIMIDSNFNKIDSFKCTNGLDGATNAHDFTIYPSGDYYLCAYDDQTLDMTAYGGLPDATVTGFVIQKFDAGKNLLLEWRSWDHLEISDANVNVSLVGALVDYVHGNSVEEDTDGNLFFSARNMCELIKVNAETGDVMWRLGGENNEFTFIGDSIPLGFSFQHDARKLSNGNIMLFNNGNYLPVQESSAKEYQLDEVNKTATLVWEYYHPKVYDGTVAVYGRASGSVQRLKNGNTLIGWGTVIQNPTLPNATEVDPEGNIVWEMAFDSLAWKSYRFHKYEWNPCSRATAYKLKAEVKPGKVVLTWEPATGAKSYLVRYKPAGNGSWIQMNTQHPKLVLTQYETSTDYVWKVRSICMNGVSSNYTEERTFTTLAQRLLNEEPSLTSITLYPNPAGNNLNLSLSTRSNLSGTVTIFSPGGIALKVAVMEAGMAEWQLDVSELASGFYFVKVETGEESMVQSFVKE